MLSYDKMTTLSVGSQDQLDGMAISHKFKFVDDLYQNVRNVGYIYLSYFSLFVCVNISKFDNSTTVSWKDMINK
uniref:Uncharacterized protein n=1 Tax=Candidatus Methanophaga sp. ANME-1 ERB7 TaxID=2759913 RepID=A0A7G9Z3W4_9EURY|nr:hypothetical protein MCEIKFBD_00009 [Methanosarcinales archaeon ANME-1 ERB7]